VINNADIRWTKTEIHFLAFPSTNGSSIQMVHHKEESQEIFMGHLLLDVIKLWSPIDSSEKIAAD
jgi:hypothetical protein